MKINLRLNTADFAGLQRHLFPGDNDEHGAVLAAGISRSKEGIRFLVNKVFIAQDGVDYVPGKFGYRALTPEFVARTSDYCSRRKLSYFAVHCHQSDKSVGFSKVDLNSHERGYQAIVDILEGNPVGALVFGRNNVAGRVWLDGRKVDFDEFVVIGASYRRLHSKPPTCRKFKDAVYDRQSMLFGSRGQQLLAEAKVGIIGVGGAGSLVNEWLARLGVGSIVVADPDKFEITNYSRVVGSRKWDAMHFLRSSRFQFLQRIGAFFAKDKVRIAKRLAKKINSKIHYTALRQNITELSAASCFKYCDYIFLCADSMQARLVFNAIVHQYLIPGIQVGAKIPVDKDTGEIGEPFVVSRPVFPETSGGCLLCNDLIPASKLQDEALNAEERANQRYIDDANITAPSVITMNALACGNAVNDFLYTFLGLSHKGCDQRYLLNYCRDRKWVPVDIKAKPNCMHCSRDCRSSFAMGDVADLPCR